MCDEMKLKSFHSKSHEVTCVATEGDGNHMDQELKKVFHAKKYKDSKVENEEDKGVTTYIIQ